MAELGLTQDTRRLIHPSMAAVAGFDAVGRVAGQDAPARVRCHELLGLHVTDDTAAVDAMAARLAEDAAAVGAEWVLTTFVTEPSAVAVARWAAMFAEAGAGLAVEFSPLGPVASIAETLHLLGGVRATRVAMVIDSWNVCFGPTTWDDLATVPLEAIAYVQFADALAPLAEPDLDEALTRRALPGEGVLELDRFVGTLRERGWDGLVSMQVLSDELRELSVDEYLRRVHHAGAACWA